jgi:LacI family transcriptional regulator
MPRKQPKPGTVNLDAIARACGVSRSTVSKALNPDRTRADISEKLRARVRTVAAEMGYRPEDDPRWVGHRVERMVGWVYGRVAPYLRGPYAQLPEMLAVRLADLGWSLHFVPLPSGTDGPAILRRQGIEGAIVVQPETEAVVSALASCGLPAVALNIRPKLDIDAVLVDDLGSARELGRRLIACGHRRFGLVSPIHSDPRVPGHHSVAARRAGLRQALAAQPGCTLDEIEIPQGPAGVDILATWLRTWRPGAVFTYDAHIAARLYQAADTAGLAIPQRLSVVCADGADIAELLSPPLTAVALPLAAMADAAVEMLLRRINGDGSTHEERSIPGSVVERGSMAAPAS